MKTEDTICQAIHERKLIGFYYDGHYRHVEPHFYGIGNGEPRLLGYQVAGKSNSGSPTSWRQFKTEKMAYVRVLDLDFDGSRLKSEPANWDRLIAIVN